MKALIVREDPAAAAGCAQALSEEGFQVTCVETQSVARAVTSLGNLDLMIMDETVNGRLTHALALAAERFSPAVTSILISDRSAEDMDELYDLIPSLYGLLDSKVPVSVVRQLSMAATFDFADAEIRKKRLAELAMLDRESDTETPDVLDDLPAELVAHDRADQIVPTGDLTPPDQAIPAFVARMDLQRSQQEQDALLVDIGISTGVAAGLEKNTTGDRRSPNDPEGRKDQDFQYAEQRAFEKSLRDLVLNNFEAAADSSASISEHRFIQRGPAFKADDPLVDMANAS